MLSAEFAALKEECANLRLRIQDIESEMKKYVMHKRDSYICHHNLGYVLLHLGPFFVAHT